MLYKYKLQIQVTWLVVTGVRSKSFMLATEHCHYNARHIFHRRVWYCVFSLRYACTWKFGHHPHPLGYLCARFRCFCGHRYWASPLRKLHTQSLIQLPSLFDAPVIFHQAQKAAGAVQQIHKKGRQIVNKWRLSPTAKWPQTTANSSSLTITVGNKITNKK